jgi:hypothetical protein
MIRAEEELEHWSIRRQQRGALATRTGSCPASIPTRFGLGPRTLQHTTRCSGQERAAQFLNTARLSIRNHR